MNLCYMYIYVVNVTSGSLTLQSMVSSLWKSSIDRVVGEGLQQQQRKTPLNYKVNTCIKKFGSNWSSVSGEEAYDGQHSLLVRKNQLR